MARLRGNDEGVNARGWPAFTEETQRSDVDSSDQPIPEGYFSIRGRVVDEPGAGVVGAKVFIEGRYRNTPTAVTDANGDYEVLAPVIADRQRWDHVISVRVEDPVTGKISAIMFNRLHSAFSNTSDQVISVPNLTIVVPPTVPVTVTDKNGMPLSDAFVGMIQSPIVLSVVKTDGRGYANVPVVRNSLPSESKATAFLFALKNGEGIAFEELPVDDDIQPVSIGLSGAEPVTVYAQVAKPVDGNLVYEQFGSSVWNLLRSYGPASGVQILPVFYDDGPHAAVHAFVCSSLASPFCAVTDEQGLATIEWMPMNSGWRRQVETADARYFHPAGARAQQDGEVAKLTLEPMIEVGGVASDDRKQPLENATVECKWSGLSGEDHLHGNASALTDSSGKFRFRVPGGTQVSLHAHREDAYGSAVRFETMNAYFGKRVIVDEYKNLRLTIANENRVFGVVTSGPEQTPLRGIRVGITRLVGNSDRVRFLPGLIKTPWTGDVSDFKFAVETDENGRYEFTTADGEWLIRHPLGEPPRLEGDRFKVSGGLETRKDFHSDTMTQLTIHLDSEEQNAKPGEPRRLLEGRGHPKPDDFYAPWHKVLRRKPRAIEVEGNYIAWDGSATQLTLTPGARINVSGRLIDEHGQSAGKRSIRYVVHPQVLDGFPLPSPVIDTISGQIDSNDDGTFKLDKFLRGCVCEVQVTADEGIEWAQQRWTVVAKVTPTSADPIDVGKLVVPEKIATAK